MSSNQKLTRLIAAAEDLVDVQPKADALEAKLLAVVALLLKECDIHAGRRLMREHHFAASLCLTRMAAADLRALSKKWNPHRVPAPAKAYQQDLIDELIALACSRIEPARKAPKATTKKSARIAAE
jgi:hypothetical protein